jgi:hypothetical protein
MSNSAHILTDRHFSPITSYYPTVTFLSRTPDVVELAW